MLNLEKYLAAQREEIERFIWCKGTELNHNPIEDKTEEEWFIEWIEQYGEVFAIEHRSEFQTA
jgi:hypothetical protein